MSKLWRLFKLHVAILAWKYGPDWSVRWTLNALHREDLIQIMRKAARVIVQDDQRIKVIEIRRP